MKKSELFFNVLAVPVDFLMIFGATSLAYFFRYRVESLPVQFTLSYTQYLNFTLIGTLFLLLLFAFFGLYTQKSTRGVWSETGRVATAVSAGLMIVVILFFFDKNLFPSRLIILTSWVFTILFVSMGRGALLGFQRKQLAHGVGRHRLLVIKGIEKSKVVEEIRTNPNLGYEIVAELKFTANTTTEIETIHRHNRIDELIQADTSLTHEQVLGIVNLCEDLGIKFIYVPSILGSHLTNIETDTVGDLPIIRLRNTPLDGWGKVAKRMIDIIVSLISLIILAPIFLVIAILIVLDSPGPIFFHQKRGSSFHKFQFYKFRTMYTDLSEGTEKGDQFRRELEKKNARLGPYVKIKNDPRVTRVGRFLRKTKLDEFPQLWHILRGQMSLVGPRIHMVKEVEKFENQYKRIFIIKPGATGLGQINQFYNPELPFEEEIKLDLFYIKNWSIATDLRIILKTIVLLFTKMSKTDY